MDALVMTQMNGEPHMTDEEMEAAKAEYITHTALHLVEVGLKASEAADAATLAANYADAVNAVCKSLSTQMLVAFDPRAKIDNKPFNRDEHGIFVLGLIEGTALQVARMQQSFSDLIDIARELGLDWPGASRLAHLDEDGNLIGPDGGSVH